MMTKSAADAAAAAACAETTCCRARRRSISKVNVVMVKSSYRPRRSSSRKKTTMLRGLLLVLLYMFNAQVVLVRCGRRQGPSPSIASNSSALQYASRTFNWTLNVSYSGNWGGRVFFPLHEDLRHTFDTFVTKKESERSGVSNGPSKGRGGGGGGSFLYPSYVRPGKYLRYIREAFLVSKVLAVTNRPFLLTTTEEDDRTIEGRTFGGEDTGDDNIAENERGGGAEKEREEEEDTLRFQNYLRRMQRPSRCVDRPMTVLADFQTHLAQMGFGSQLIILIETFWLALVEKRVFTFGGGGARTNYVDPKRCPSTLLTCVFEAPTNCSTVRWTRPGPLPDKVVYAFGGCGRQKYRSRLLRAIARDANLRSDSYNLAWYFVQLTRFVFFDVDGGLSVPTRQFIRVQLGRTPLAFETVGGDDNGLTMDKGNGSEHAGTSSITDTVSSPCIAVHVRRGDSFTDGRRLHEMREYVLETISLLRQRPDIRSIFLTSDAPISFYEEFRRVVEEEENDANVWWLSQSLFQPRGREKATTNVKYAAFSATPAENLTAAPDEASALLLTLDVMSRCTYIVGTLSSQFGKMANALALARQGRGAFGGFIDLDGHALDVCGDVLY